MALDPKIKKNWIQLQEKSTVPVNAIGLPIPAQDSFTLKVWKEEGIDQHLSSGTAATAKK